MHQTTYHNNCQFCGRPMTKSMRKLIGGTWTYDEGCDFCGYTPDKYKYSMTGTA